MAELVNTSSPAVAPSSTRSPIQVSVVLTFLILDLIILFFILVPVKGLNDRKIVQIASGAQHSIILDSEGYVSQCFLLYKSHTKIGLTMPTIDMSLCLAALVIVG